MAVYKFSNAGGFGNITRYNDFLAGNPAVIQDAGAYFPLGEFTLASAQSSITFTNIPQTYKHLQVRWSNPSSTTGGNVVVNFNSDTSTSNYAFHCVRGNGSAASALGFASGSGNSQIIANEAKYGICDILDYTNTNKYTVTRTLGGADYNNTSGYIALNSSLWLNTAAVTTIKLTCDTTGGWAQNSSIALYGIL